MKASDYTNYFRQLAVRHNKLLHNPASETGDVGIGEKHFARFGAEEVIEGLRTKVSWPALMIEMFETKTAAESVWSVRGNHFGAFSVLASAGLENMNQQEEAYNLTEEIMYDVLAQIWQDHYGSTADECNTPFQNFDFGSLIITPVGPLFDKQFGWRCEFGFDKNGIKEITQAPSAGVFI